MRVYKVILSADAIVSGTVEIRAASPEGARSQAFRMKEKEIVWEVSSLHEGVADCGTVVYLDDKEVGEAKGY